MKQVFGDAVGHRTSKFKNNRLEQDHRGVKGRTPPMRGFQLPDSAHPFWRAQGEARNFLCPATRRNQQVPPPGTGDLCPEGRRPARHARRRVINSSNSGRRHALMHAVRPNRFAHQADILLRRIDSPPPAPMMISMRWAATAQTMLLAAMPSRRHHPMPPTSSFQHAVHSSRKAAHRRRL
ncbi:hypothetical protein FW320_31625 [Azospirillum sp. Vi22]|nr:hypothetical protein [Azospirillum baldaniorum]